MSSSSNRYTHNNKREGTNNRFPNTKKFVPKTPNLTTPTTLSSSIRQQQSNSTAAITVDDVIVGPSSKSHGGNFVNYLVQDEAVAAGLGGSDPIESQRVVDLLNTQLSKLLKLNPKDFWKQVSSDGSLQGFLDSFLQFRSRWFDFPHHSAKGIVAGVIVGEFELSRRVFMVLYRISSNRDPGARASDSLSLNEHGVLLQETKLLDLSKLLNICAIYGHENEVLARELVSNAIKAQPWIHDNITAAMSHFLGIGHTLHQRCISSLEVLFSSEDSGDHNFGKLRADFLEVMDFINDAVVSMDAFVSAYNPAAVFFSCPVDLSFGNEELLITLVRLHDSLLPSLQRGFRILCSAEDKLQKIDQGSFSEIVISLKMLSVRIVRLGCKLLDLCYFSDELFKDGHPLPNLTKMFPATVEDPSIKADILLQTFQEINGVSGILDGHNIGTFLQNAEKTLGIISRFEGLQSIGWISMEAEQFQFLNGILMHSSKLVLKDLSAASISAATGKVQINDDAVIMESKISQIKELFPDYGNGFLSACLEVYNQNPEDVIQRILEGTLHKDLLSLDTSMENVPSTKSSSSVSNNDKGKGKLFDMPPPLSKPVPASVGPTSLSSSSTGRFIRKSKINLPSPESMDSRNEQDIARTSALISQYEYEDEYDDSFDDLGLSVGDSGLEETEMNSNLGRSSESSAQNPSNTKWNSNNKKPQFFVKDGKNYSYKVQGSVAVANSKEASLLNEAQRDQIHGLGRGGNLPLGAVKKLQEAQKEKEQQEEEQSEVTDDTGGTSNVGNRRGRGGRRGGGGRNSYRKDQAMKKQFSGLRGF